MHAAPPPPRLPSLTRQDLIRFEPVLREVMARFLAFDSHSLYFPATGGAVPTQPSWLAGEKRLFLPLTEGPELLGVLVLKNVRLKAPKTQLAQLGSVAQLCLENLALRKAAVCDPLTGLLNRQAFLTFLTRQIGQIQDCILPAQSTCLDPGLTSFSGRCAVLVLDLDGYQAYAERHGALEGESLLVRMAGALGAKSPPEAALCRLEEDRFALALPEISASAGLSLAEKLAAAVAEVRPEDTDSLRPVRLAASCGLAGYPGDLRGPEYLLSPAETARLLLRKARRALAVAKGRGGGRACAFHDIVGQGGTVLEILPLARVCISLGRAVDAQEGMRFLVQSPRFLREATATDAAGGRLSGAYPAMVKGEIILTEVQEDMAFGEILNESDAAWPIEKGDRLALIREEPAESAAKVLPGPSPQKDILTGLFANRDFLAHLGEARRRFERFVLALVRLPSEAEGHGADFQHEAEERTRAVAALAAPILGPGAEGGRYSVNSLAYFLPEAEPEAARGQFTALVAACREQHGFAPAVGLAAHPFLHFTKAEILANCRKALDHALLLTPPQVAVCDTLSLNVSADRLFAKGDLYGAMEEYKLSLLADEANNLARNSLAVCYARLGKLAEAAQLFLEVSRREPKNIMARYNYGYSCLRLKDLTRAAKAFRGCLKRDGTHVFSLVRLGQIAEQQGKNAAALKSYRKAAALPGGEPLAARHLARLCLARGEVETARDHLHRAIAHNPQDAQSVALLAGLYLDSGEDPEIAALLARQATALNPGAAENREIMARALTALGRPEEAKAARARSAAR